MRDPLAPHDRNPEDAVGDDTPGEDRGAPDGDAALSAVAGTDAAMAAHTPSSAQATMDLAPGEHDASGAAGENTRCDTAQPVGPSATAPVDAERAGLAADYAQHDDEPSPQPQSAGRQPATAIRPARRRFRDRPRNWWLDTLRGEHPAPAARPTMAPGGASAPDAPPRRVGWLGTRSGRGAIVAAIGLILIGLALGRLLAQPSASVPPVATATPVGPTPAPFAPVSGAPLTVAQVLGANAGLLAPAGVVALPGGRVAIADTGNARLVVLDAQGHLLHAASKSDASLQQPDAVVVTAGGLAVLDAQSDAILRFDDGGHYLGQLAHGSAFHDARGLAVGPDGRLYVANPLSNSIVVVSPDGTIERQIHSALGAAPGQFNQVSDVAVGANGTLYVLDNQNNRIEALTNAGAFLAQWPAPASSTIDSVHLLPLSKGRLLASDPGSGSLLVYSPGGGAPTRSALLERGQQLSDAQPLGLARAAQGRVLVADGHGNRVLVVSLPSGLG